uniref:BACK domain-containing protein n=1 Tax=Magallana gigas TaxID=29159 RepID=K1PI28_MAGGI
MGYLFFHGCSKCRKSHRLDVNSEMDILESAVSWLHHHKEDRMKNLERVMDMDLSDVGRDDSGKVMVWGGDQWYMVVSGHLGSLYVQGRRVSETSFVDDVGKTMTYFRWGPDEPKTGTYLLFDVVTLLQEASSGETYVFGGLSSWQSPDYRGKRGVGFGSSKLPSEVEYDSRHYPRR